MSVWRGYVWICRSMDISFWLKAWHSKRCFESQRTIIVTQRDFLQVCEKFRLLVFDAKSSFKKCFYLLDYQSGQYETSLDPGRIRHMDHTYCCDLIAPPYFHAGIMTIFIIDHLAPIRWFHLCSVIGFWIISTLQY